jgi:hypothetical protein
MRRAGTTSSCFPTGSHQSDRTASPPWLARTVTGERLTPRGGAATIDGGWRQRSWTRMVVGSPSKTGRLVDAAKSLACCGTTVPVSRETIPVV